MVVGCLGIESILVSVLILFLWWWIGLMLGILRMRWHFGMVVLRRWWILVGCGGILRILDSQIDDRAILDRSR